MERELSWAFATYLAGAVLLVQAMATIPRILGGSEIGEVATLAVVGAIFFWVGLRKLRGKNVGRG